MEENFWHLIYLVSGIYLLVRGADHLVDGASAIALRLKIPPMIVGLTIVSFATSCPELATTVRGALKSAQGIEGPAAVAVGNVVGSNIANTALILGIAAFLAPIRIQTTTNKVEIPVMILFSAVLGWLVLRGPLDTFAGIILLVLFAAFIVYLIHASFRAMARGGKMAGDVRESHVTEWKKMGLTASILWIVLGLILLGVGAELMLDAAVALALSMGISNTMVGLTVVAIGTSLPELAASAVAARKGHADIALGNVLGSNIFNIGLVLGVPAVMAGLPVPDSIASRDIWVMISLAVVLVPFSVLDRKITKQEGLTLLLAYTGYLIWVVLAQF